MDTQIQLSPKQIEFMKHLLHRWTFKIGATQCGKTFIDVQFTIPSRIIEGTGKKGLNVILGVSKETIERNVLEPMRDIWGENLVSPINSRNFATLFGEKVYCLGAEKVSQVSKLRGAKFKYAYVDEVVDINEEVFQLLKSRLSLPYSCCDATGNPSYPSHFIKKFIDSSSRGVDIYFQKWTLYDNPFLDPIYIKSLESEYAGTVFYNRYIKGEWTRAEGLVYPMYMEATEDASPASYSEYGLSIDYGTQNAFAALLWGKENNTWHVFSEYYYSGRDVGRQKTDEDYKRDMVDFVSELPRSAFSNGLDTYIDPSAASFEAALREVRTKDGIRMFRTLHAVNDVSDGIRDTARCMQRGYIKINSRACPNTMREFGGYVWDKTEDDDRPVKENDHAMDALRYFVYSKRLVKPVEEYRSPFRR